jgi:hypothetical protein
MRINQLRVTYRFQAKQGGMTSLKTTARLSGF